MTISFCIPGTPKPKARHRSAIIAGKIRTYTPAATADYERSVAMAAKQAMLGQQPIDGAVSILVSAVMPIPKSWSNAKQHQAEQGLINPTSRPDLDNLVKAVKDGINGIVWRDDSQVVQISAVKSYGTSPRVDVVVRKIGN